MYRCIENEENVRGEYRLKKCSRDINERKQGINCSLEVWIWNWNVIAFVDGDDGN